MPPLSYYDKLGLSPIPRRTPITSITFKRKSIKLLIIVYERVSKKSTNVDTYGHWWVEFDNESYGWWPAHGVSLWETLTGVPGQLNGMGENPDPQRDVHHGDTAEKEFHPYLYVGNIFPTYMQYGAGKGKKCSCVNETQIKDCMRTFAHSYSGSWSYPWGKNCHSFQQKMMNMCCLREARY